MFFTSYSVSSGFAKMILLTHIYNFLLVFMPFLYSDNQFQEKLPDKRSVKLPDSRGEIVVNTRNVR